MLKILIHIALILGMSVSYNVSAIETKHPLTFCIDSKDNFPSHGVAGTENNEYPGIFIEQMKIIAIKTHIEIAYVRAPWKRCLIELEKGNLDGVICASYDVKREIFGVYPRNINGEPDPLRRFYDSSYFLYVNESSDIYWDGNKTFNLNGPIAAQQGFSIVPFLKGVGADVILDKSAEKNFLKLSKNRVAAVAAHVDTGDALMLKFGRIKKIPIPLKSKPYYLLMSHQLNKSHPTLVQSIWTASGESQLFWLEKIKEKYKNKKIWTDLNNKNFIKTAQFSD